MNAVEEGHNLAVSYREAAEADTMQTMNVQSSGTGLDDLLFYVVPATWYRNAWKLLLSPKASIPEDWREQIGALPAVKPWFESDKDVLEKKGDVLNEMKSVWSQKAISPIPSARSRKEHEKDYFFVGQNTWSVLANKFGANDSANAVACHVVSFPTQDSKLAVNLPDAFRVPIPGSGRFPYESLLETDDNVVMEDVMVVNRVEEEDDQAQTDASTREEPILMLPPSTTQQSPHHSRASAASISPTLREYGSGLANLGNTCFMSSTIQCLGHASPVLKYFLSGSFMDDLNRDNPLGTGGDLAVEFCKLLREIWVDNASEGPRTHYGYVANHVVHPRSFKSTIGRHAEQFSGYDQHDSQEFATYLLDALHEDTNRISKKPYIEKPEQGENETDEEAAQKAWELHLKRENSHIVDFFMGQVKSRVQCCEENCGRVSTTFDPFMYLSVPIPGTDDRQIKTVFIPLDPDRRPLQLTLIVPKTGSIADLIGKCRERAIALGFDPLEVAEEDLVAVDVWSCSVFAWHKLDDALEKIKDTDYTYIYQLRSLKEVRRLSTTPVATEETEEDPAAWELPSRGRKYQLDVASLRRLNPVDSWQNEFNHYLSNIMAFVTMMNPQKGSIKGKLQFLKQLMAFLAKCHEVLGKESDVDGESDEAHAVTPKSMMQVPNKNEVPALVELSEDSNVFEHVESVYDVTILEFLAGKLRDEISNSIRREKTEHLADGAIIQVLSRKFGSSSYSYSSTSRDQSDTAPLILRIPSNMTVYELREELAYRMRRSIQTGRETMSYVAGEATAEASQSSPPRDQTPNDNGHDNAFGPPESFILRQVPLSFEKQGSHRKRSCQLGALAKPSFAMAVENKKRSSSLVDASEEEEKEHVAMAVGVEGTVFLEWPEDLANDCFNTYEYNATEEASDEADVLESYKPKTATTVLDCIDKYCQMEQLEETEMWYCSKCQKHVRAWKQFHLYRSPPILIIHLKRFQYSATSHRRDKINEFIDFPLQGLDLSQHFMSWKEEERPIYDCFGVSNHFGGLGGGHYTAHALHNNGVWCYYDDTRITSNVEPGKAVTNAAYVLYYRRRDVPTDLDFSISADTPEIRRAPTVILENPDAQNSHSDTMSDSNAAIIGDDDDNDNMEVDNLDTDSRSTSTTPMESPGSEGDQVNDNEVESPRQ